MKLAILCETCGNQQIAVCDASDPQIIGAMIIACHAVQPHSNNHRMKVLIDDNDPSTAFANLGRQVELRILCKHQGCVAPQPVMYKVPAFMASGMVIAHHAQHEGHALEIWMDNNRIHPPR